MARGKSVRLLASIPPKYTPDFMKRVDRRTVLGKAVLGLHTSLIEHLGGDSEVTVTLRSIVNRYTWAEMILQGIECRAAGGEEIDVGSWSQLTNTQLGLARLLGLKRRQRPVESLHDLMYQHEPVAPSEAQGDDLHESDATASPDEIAAAAPCAEAAP